MSMGFGDSLEEAENNTLIDQVYKNTLREIQDQAINTFVCQNNTLIAYKKLMQKCMPWIPKDWWW